MYMSKLISYLKSFKEYVLGLIYIIVAYIFALSVPKCGGTLHGQPNIALPRPPLSLNPSTPATSASGKTSGFELSHGYSFNAAATPEGEPYTSGWGYVGGRAGPGPSYLTDNTGFLPTDLWSGRNIDLITGGLYLMSGIVGLSSLYYTFSPLIHSTANRNPSSPSTGGAASKLLDQSPKNGTKKAKSRTRRAINGVDSTHDDDVARLVDVVYNAISYGECLQKTICEVAHELGSSPNGRRALSFKEIKGHFYKKDYSNAFFLTMRKAFGAENPECERFKCPPEFRF